MFHRFSAKAATSPGIHCCRFAISGPRASFTSYSKTTPTYASRHNSLAVPSQYWLNDGADRRSITTQSGIPMSDNSSSSSTTRMSTAPNSGIRLSPPRPRRIVVGVTGATGTLYAIRLLQVLRDLNIETDLVMSKWAVATMKYETPMTEAEFRNLATRNYTMKDVSAPPSSGSYLHDGMIIVPCSMKTLSAVRTGFCDDLITRSADVTLKEGRKLMLVVRETPLSDIHLDNMMFLRRAGAIIFPPVPALYTRPKSVEDIVDQSVGRMLDGFGIHTESFERWTGFRKD